MDRKIKRRTLLVGLGLLSLALATGIGEKLPDWLDPKVEHGYGAGVYGSGLYGKEKERK